jgi:hypothetical protein
MSVWKLVVRMDGSTGSTDTGERFDYRTDANERRDAAQADADSRGWGVMRYSILHVDAEL